MVTFGMFKTIGNELHNFWTDDFDIMKEKISIEAVKSICWINLNSTHWNRSTMWCTTGSTPAFWPVQTYSDPATCTSFLIVSVTVFHMIHLKTSPFLIGFIPGDLLKGINWHRSKPSKLL